MISISPNSDKAIAQSDGINLIAQRQHKLAQLRAAGNAYPNHFRRCTLIAEIINQYQTQDKLTPSLPAKSVQIAGRILRRRTMGKASFLDVQDMSGCLQVYVHNQAITADHYETFKTWDLGDIIGIEGPVFRTKTGELSIKASQLYLLTKALRPLPDKFHGLQDPETRYRQRYIDLIVNPSVRDTFLKRSQLLREIRYFFEKLGYLEVETPMMHPIAGGALARPFTTHHNALNMPLYLRVAPELYLKRLVVGGFEKVYEINRNFRNEGLSSRHNPEFTMLEFYQAYADYHDLMDLIEILLRTLAQTLLGTLQVPYQEEIYDLSFPFQRLTIVEALLKYHAGLTLETVQSLDVLRRLVKHYQISVSIESIGALQFALFEKTVESKLRQPTFITAHPIEVSPLARRNDQNPMIADRFEFYIGGRELANGFSELNDPEDQAARFQAQLKAGEAGDLEAMAYDQDYITALEYGLPPTAGAGIGIDRLTMLLTNSTSIRDVILFPLLKPRV
jgi:lysyl-tRNA synthetase, class II